MSEKGSKGIEEIIASMEGATRAQPPGRLFHKIEARIAGALPVVRTVPFQTVSLAAASILLLFFINFIVVKTQVAKPAQEPDGVQQVAEYYGLTDNFGI